MVIIDYSSKEKNSLRIFNEISKIDTYKGNMKLTKEMMIAQDGLISEKKISQLLNKNVSDIAFIQKK